MRNTSVKFLFTLGLLILIVSGTQAQIGVYETIINDTLYSIKISSSDSSNYKYKISELDTSHKEISSIIVLNIEEEMFMYKINHSNFFNSDSALKIQLSNKFWIKVKNEIETAKLEEIRQNIATLSKRDFIATINLKSNSKYLDLSYTECCRKKGCNTKDSNLIYKNQSSKFEPKKIDIAFENGIIKNIQTIGKIGDKKRIFITTDLINIRSKDDYVKLNTDGYYILECELDKKRSATFNLSDLLFFEIEKIYGSGTYIPSDTTITIHIPENKSTKIYGKSMNDNLDMRLYTDVTGFDAESFNGKFQFELKYNLYTRAYYFGKSWFFIERISPFLNLSKIGESNDALILNDSTLSEQNSNIDIPQFDLLKHSYLFSGIDMNIVKRSGSTVAYSLNLLIGVYRTTLTTINSDTSKTDTANYIVTTSTESNNINSWFWGVNLDATIFENANINLNFSASFLISDLFKPTDGISPNHTKVFSVLVGMNYFPNEYNKTTALFFRTRFYLDVNSHDENINFETGVYLPLTKFFSSFGI
jgi:hypothetical protein